jgi:glycosyltransferase involved in cell wall biosynthesis
MTRVAVVIPALDEAGSLTGVLAGLAQHGVHVVVVDNGSTDDTAAVAAAGGATVIAEPRRGYGSAVLAGLRQLEADPPDVVVILDADGADDLARLPDLVGPIERGEADLVLSDRSRGAARGALTPVQRFGNAFAVRLIAHKTGHRYRDMGPFRALSWSALARLEMRDPTWGWNVEMQVKAAQRGLRVREVAVQYGARTAGRSKISGTVRGSIRAGVRIVQAVSRYSE